MEDGPILDRASGNANSHDHNDAFADSALVHKFRISVDKQVATVDQLEQKVNKVAQFYSSLNKKQLNCKGSSVLKDKDKEKLIASKKQHQDSAKSEAAAAKRMQELIRQFGTIFRKITAHDWAWPFMEPVDVEGLGLHDYYEVIEKPMDFGTIKKKMEAKDGAGYKNVREMCTDVRLVFKNAMTYNNERADVHIMAKTLLDKFEEKWLQLLPKVIEEETRRKEEEAEAQRDMQLAQEVANAKLARELSSELCEVDMRLDELRETVVKKCRKMSVEEKRKLGAGLSRLSPEDLMMALEIIAQKNPSFETTAEEVDIDMDAQVQDSELKSFDNKNASKHHFKPHLGRSRQQCTSCSQMQDSPTGWSINSQSKCLGFESCWEQKHFIFFRYHMRIPRKIRG